VIEKSNKIKSKIVNLLRSIDKNIKITTVVNPQKALSNKSKTNPDVIIINQTQLVNYIDKHKKEKQTKNKQSKDKQLKVPQLSEMKKFWNDSYFILLASNENEEKLNPELIERVDDIVFANNDSILTIGINLAINRYKKNYQNCNNIDDTKLRSVELIKLNDQLKKKVNERTWALEVLRKSRDEYRMLVENSDDMIFSVDLLGNFVFTNQAVKKHLGFSEKELKRINGFELIHPDDLQTVQERFTLLPEGKSIIDLEYRYKTKNGTYINILNNAAPIFNSKGHITGALGIARNITERKKIQNELKKAYNELESRVSERTAELEQANKELKAEIKVRQRAEEALQESEARYRSLVETSQDLIWRCDGEGRFSYLNKAWEITHGYKLEKMLGKKFTDFQTKEVAARDTQEFGRYLNGGSIKGYETSHISKSGQTIHLVFNAIPVFDENEMIIGTQGTAIDITERKKAEEALRESEENYRNIFNSANDAFFVLDMENNIVDANPAACKMYGYKYKELLKVSPKALIHPDSLHIFGQFKKKLRTSKELIAEVINIRKNGTPFDVEVKICLFDYKGKKHLLNISRDITERKRTDEALKKASKEWQETFDAIQDIVLMVSPKHDIIRLNESACKVVGKNANDLVGKKCYEVFHGLDKPIEGCPCLLTIQSKKDEVNEITQNEKSFIATSSPIFDEKNDMVGIAHTVKDITKRKKDEEYLRYQSLLLNQSSDYIITSNLKGQITYANEAIAKALNKTQEQLIGSSVSVFYDEAGETSNVDIFEQTINDGHWFGQKTMFMGNGTRRIIDLHTQLLMDDDEKPSGLFAIGRDITERKQANEALRESEEKFRNIIEQSSDGIVLMNEKGNIIEWNHALELITGIKRDEILGKPIWEAQFMTMTEDRKLDTKFGKTVRKEMQKFMKNIDKIKPSHTMDQEILSLDDKRKTVQISIFPIFTEKEKMICGINRDITKIKQAEQWLRESEERFRNLTDLLPEGVFEIDLNGNFTFVNKKAFEMSGYSQADIDNGLNAFRIIVPEEHDRMRKNIQLVLSGQDLGVHEYTAIKKDGTRFPVLIHSNVIIINDKPKGLRGIIIDITERKLLEEKLKNKLRESEYLFQLSEGLKYSDTIEDVCKKGLVSICSGFNIDKGIFFLMDKNIDYLNLLQTHGIKIQKQRLRIPIWEDRNILRTAALENKWFNAKNGKFDHTKDKTVIPEILSKLLGFPKKDDSLIIAPINSKKKAIGLVILDTSNFSNQLQVSKDMLDMYLTTIGVALENVGLYKELEESVVKLQEIDKMRSEFIDVASHELRTPLSAIKIYTDLMRDGYIGKFNSNEQKRLDDMNKNIFNLNNLINGMLDFTRTGKDFSKLTLEKVVLTDIAKEIISDFRPLAKTRNISIKFRSKGDTVATLDYEMIKKIFSNLISNAVKYSHDGGHVSVKVSGELSHNIIVVKDNGIGITKIDLPHIFERFYMGDTSLTREKDQLGLGLSIVKSIVERHGGTIQVESDLGKGSVFTVTLPKKPKNKKKGDK
jgi:PAS domain S-box-containing protein